MKIDIKSDSFFYQDIAMPLADTILSLFKGSCKEYFDYFSWVYDHPIDSDELIVSYKLTIVRSDFDTSKKKYDIWGSAGIDESGELSIWITIVIPPKKWQKNIVIDKPELVGTLAHEIHHIAQSMHKGQLDSPEDEKFSYFLDPMEIEAFHIGFRAQSALSGSCFSKLAHDYLSQAASSRLSKEEILKVVSAWKETDYPVFSSVPSSLVA